MERSSKPATTVTKVCRILSEFRGRPSLGVSELANRLDLLPSDVHRILSSLVAHGFIEQNPRTRTYRLGVSVVRLGLEAVHRNELPIAARPLLVKLAEEIDATTHMVVFDSRELEIFLAEQVDHKSETIFRVRYGALTNGHSTALGKTILANILPELAASFLSRSGLPEITRNTITEMPLLLEELARIARLGYAVDREETALGACCLAAPVRDAFGVVVAAISVSMSASRFYRAVETDLASTVIATARELSRMSC